MPDLPTNRKYVSTKTAAKIFGCTQGRIRQLVLAGVLDHWKIGGRLALDEDQVRCEAVKKPNTGRPRKFA